MRKGDYPETDPCHHVANIHGLLEGLQRHCREDIGKVNEQKAQAIFETTAEVLGGLMKAYEDYAAGRERGMATD